MSRELISYQSHSGSEQVLQSLYEKSLIPSEKKPFLIDANACCGPFMKVELGGFIMDLASQIASMGLGFSHSSLFGTTQFLESWLGHTQTDVVGSVKHAFEELLQRKLGSNEYRAHFCSSGAEAIEIGLGHCFEKFGGKRRKILAFEKSFHGRTLVALSCTFNPAKREPFAWPQFETEFVPYPEIDGDDIEGNCRVNSDNNGKELDNLESEILSQIKSHLASDQYMAVLIEPMQCEGGDRYSSTPFHLGLSKLCAEFDVPLVYDEIQTGFGLGNSFFWHRQFVKEASCPERVAPDIVISAKKAQVGVVLSRLSNRLDIRESFSVASLIRGYLQASMIDQFQDRIDAIGEQVRERLAVLVSDNSNIICRPRNRGLCFAFDFQDAEMCQRFVGERFKHGLLYYPAGEKTARFRMSLGFSDNDLEFAFDKINLILSSPVENESQLSKTLVAERLVKKTASNFEFHRSLIARKRTGFLAGEADENGSRCVSAESYLSSELKRLGLASRCVFKFLDEHSYPKFRDEIKAIQIRVYEPARQSPIEEFDRIFRAKNPLSIVILEGERIVGMAFAGPLALFPEISGVTEDPLVDDRHTYYMLDLTVDQGFRGGLGRVLKQALTLLAIDQQVTGIHGRNRDHLAKGMWAINLSLGSFTTQYLKDNYPDESANRDCFYYRCPTTWEYPKLNLSNAIESPLGPSELSNHFVKQNMGVLINKLTHSNFLTGDMARQLPEAFETFDERLRHGFTASGLSEAVDKIVKVFWLKRRPRTKIVAVRGSDWGQGSFFARSLSQVGTPFFESQFVSNPEDVGDKKFLAEVEAQIDDECFAFFVEPLMSNTMQRIEESVLARAVNICRERAVPVIFNETCSMFYRYSSDHFSSSLGSEVTPDGSVAFLGGQMAIVGVREEFFANDPLMLISTWDGDAYSLARFVAAKRHLDSELNAHKQVVAEFDTKLSQLLEGQVGNYKLSNGIGWFDGTLTQNLEDVCDRAPDSRALICPSYWQMEAFLETKFPIKRVECD